MKITKILWNDISRSVIVAVIFMSLAASCQSSSAYKKANQAAFDIAVGIEAASQITSTLNKQGVIADKDYAEIIKIEQQVVEVDDAFLKLLQSSTEINANNKGAYLGLINTFLDTLTQMDSVGTLHIKSESARASFLASVATAKVALIVIKNFIDTLKDPIPTAGFPTPQVKFSGTGRLIYSTGPTYSITPSSTIVPYSKGN